MVVAWLPDGVAWQPYGPFAELRRVILCLGSGFCVLCGRCVGQKRFF